jgi:hypothetical protein
MRTWMNACGSTSAEYRGFLRFVQISANATGHEFGAGEGNRTLVFSLEGCCSTIELHPQPRCLSAAPLWHSRLLKATASGAMRWLPVRQWWRGLDLNQRRHSQRIYSPSPLTTRAPLRTAAGAMQRGIKTKRPPRAAVLRSALWRHGPRLSTAMDREFRRWIAVRQSP